MHISPKKFCRRQWDFGAPIGKKVHFSRFRGTKKRKNRANYSVSKFFAKLVFTKIRKYSRYLMFILRLQKCIDIIHWKIRSHNQSPPWCLFNCHLIFKSIVAKNIKSSKVNNRRELLENFNETHADCPNNGTNGECNTYQMERLSKKRAKFHFCADGWSGPAEKARYRENKVHARRSSKMRVAVEQIRPGEW